MCVTGKIKSITDFGIFIGLNGGIDGLVHLSDISWNGSGDVTVHNYKKGDEISAIVLQVDSERERISLGIKQLEEDPLNIYIDNYKKGTVITGIIKSIDKKNIIVKLSENIEGIIKYTDELRGESDKNFNEFKVNDKISVKLSSFDRKNRIIYLSVHIVDEKEKKSAISNVNKKKNDDMFSNVMKEAFKAAKNTD